MLIKKPKRIEQAKKTYEQRNQRLAKQRCAFNLVSQPSTLTSDESYGIHISHIATVHLSHVEIFRSALSAKVPASSDAPKSSPKSLPPTPTDWVPDLVESRINVTIPLTLGLPDNLDCCRSTAQRPARFLHFACARFACWVALTYNALEGSAAQT